MDIHFSVYCIRYYNIRQPEPVNDIFHFLSNKQVKFSFQKEDIGTVPRALIKIYPFFNDSRGTSWHYRSLSSLAIHNEIAARYLVGAFECSA